MNFYRTLVLIAFSAALAVNEAVAQTPSQNSGCLDHQNCSSTGAGVGGSQDQTFSSDYLNFLASQFGAQSQSFNCLSEECNMPKAECEAHCDHVYNNIVDWCRSLRTSQERAICYGDASAEYGRCLAMCPRN